MKNCLLIIALVLSISILVAQSDDSCLPGGIIFSTQEETISLHEEYSTIQNYMQLQKVVFEIPV